MSTTDHYLVKHYDPPVYGDRPEPWRIEFTCGCGAELWDSEEGRSSTAGTPEEALEEHIAQEEPLAGHPEDDPDCDCNTDDAPWAGEEDDAALRHCDLPCCNPEPEDAADRQRAAALAVSTASNRHAIEYLRGTPEETP